eukprot:s8666_g2.t1
MGKHMAELGRRQLNDTLYGKQGVPIIAQCITLGVREKVEQSQRNGDTAAALRVGLTTFVSRLPSLDGRHQTVGKRRGGLQLESQRELSQQATQRVVVRDNRTGEFSSTKSSQGTLLPELAQQPLRKGEHACGEGSLATSSQVGAQLQRKER